MQTPLSQISSPNATPAPAKRDMPSGSAPDGEFQRTLNRQLEQRQASRANAPSPAQAARPAAPPAQATQPAQPANRAAEQAAAEQAQASNKASDKESSGVDEEAGDSEETVASEAQPPSDPIAEMLALVGNARLATQPATGSAAAGEAGARALAKADGKSLGAAQLLAGQAGEALTGVKVDADADPAAAAGFAASLGKAHAAVAAQAGKGDAGKLALDAQLAATAKSGTLTEALPKEAPPDLARLAAQLPAGALQQAAAAAAVPADKLMGRVGTPAWDQQLGQKVVWMAAGGDQTATLTLNPPDLGPLQVVLTVTNDQADAAFMSAQPEVRQALEAALPRLRDMMSEAGIAFGNATVSDGKAQQDSGQRDGAGNGRGGNQGGGVTGGEIAITQSGGARGRPTLGEVDTFA